VQLGLNNGSESRQVKNNDVAVQVAMDSIEVQQNDQDKVDLSKVP
jgi:hypothetical protein